MERINPYAVMRNTATYEAYRARMRAIMRAGQPFSIVALICWCAWLPLFGLALNRGGIWLAAADFVLVGIGVIFGAIAAIRMRRYQREHPIPDEWRPIPRVSWPPVPARKPPLP